MKKSKPVMIGIGALIIASLLMSAAIFAHPGFGPRRLGMMRRMGPPLLEQLQLSSDQRAQIDAIFASGRDTIQPLARQLREKIAALREATRTQPFDEVLVRSQAQEAANVQAQLMVARAQLISQARALLTDEQRAKLDQLREQWLEQFREWRRQHLGKPDQPQT